MLTLHSLLLGIHVSTIWPFTSFFLYMVSHFCFLILFVPLTGVLNNTITGMRADELLITASHPASVHLVNHTGVDVLSVIYSAFFYFFFYSSVMTNMKQNAFLIQPRSRATVALKHCAALILYCFLHQPTHFSILAPRRPWLPAL